MKVLFFYPHFIFMWNKKKAMNGAVNGGRIYYPLISPRAQYIYARITLVISALTMKTKSETKL